MNRLRIQVTEMSEQKKILVVDADASFRRTISDILELQGYVTSEAAIASDALSNMAESPPAVMLVDLRLQDMPGLELIQKAKKLCPNTACIVLTSHASQATAIEAVNIGAYGFLLKPCDVEQLLFTIQRALEKQHVEEVHTRLATAVDQAAEAIIITDSAGNMEYVNPAFERITGYSQEEVIGKTPRILKSGEHDSTFYRELWDTIRSGNPWRGNFVNRTKAGDTYEEEATIAPVRDSAGRIAHFVAVKRDATKERDLEKRLEQTQRMEALGQLAGGVAHDFNNILQVIQGYSEMLLRAVPGDTPNRRSIEQIRNAGDRAASLTRQLLAFSRRQVLQKKHVDLNTVISDLLKMLRRLIGEHIVVETDFADELECVYADVGQMEQVLMNLCVNARDAMPDGGKILLRSAVRDIDAKYQVDNRWSRVGHFVEVSVADTGCGIPEELQQEVFEPFFTTKDAERGTGLGLATVYGIVTQHDGFIHLESDGATGTTFRIFLPISKRRGTSEDIVEENSATGGSETILVAEDDSEVRSLVLSLLNRYGYTVIEAADGLKAMEVFEQSQEDIDLVLLDVVMPKASGRSVYEKIRATKTSIPVLFTSGYTNTFADSEFFMQEEVPLLQKPFHPEDLLSRIRTLIDGSLSATPDDASIATIPS